MRFSAFLIIATVLCSVFVVSASARQEMRACIGELEYPFVEESSLVVWPDTSCTGGLKASSFGGEITENTIITLAGQAPRTRDLDFPTGKWVSNWNWGMITGKWVCAYGIFDIQGEGEGTKVKIVSLTIVVLPNP